MPLLFLELADLSDIQLDKKHPLMLFTLLLGDKQARWKVDTMVYGIPSHILLLSSKIVFIALIQFRIYIFTLVS